MAHNLIEMNKKIIQILVTALILLISMDANAVIHKFTLFTSAPKITEANVMGSPSVPGDYLMFSANISKTQGGSSIGYFVGEQIEVLAKEVGHPEIRIASFSFMLTSKDQLYVQGANFYVSDKNPGLIVGSSVYRIVCGGTGKYFGARGEVVSTRLPDGSYKHVFKLMR